MSERGRFANGQVRALLIAGCMAGTLTACQPPTAESFDFKIAVADDGRYRVAYDDFGHDGNPPRTARLTLSTRGRPVSFTVDDGGDGRFGPGDSLQFVGVHPAGPHSWFDPWTDENIYRLRAASESAAESPRATAAGTASLPDPDPAVPTVTRHFERDEIRVALETLPGQPRDVWYWQRLSHLDRAPFRFALPAGPAPTGIRVSLAGLSADRAAAAAGIAQHRVELKVGGRIVGGVEWNGQDPATLRAGAADLRRALKGQSAHDRAPGADEVILELSVPERPVPGQAAPVIDVALLNAIEADYSANAFIETFGDAVRFAGPDGEGVYVADGEIRTPRRIRPYAPSTLQSTRRQTDYLMIVHESIGESIAPLAAFHRERGLTVDVVDVDAIYDAFNHGLESPLAIRDFIRHASVHREPPGPRFVLLVGEASWNVRNPSGRPNLVPTLQVRAHDELAASDNGFADIRDDDGRPDVAIGRLPVADATELDVVVKKLLAHGDGGSPEPWQSRAAFIADASESFQAISDELAEELAGQGLEIRTVYPDPSADTAAQEQHRLLQAFDEGQGLIHFLGHGGRFVWRTGPPDLSGATDLFSVDDLPRLRNAGRLPLVLSMTCSSGPFDHPTAGSMAEALLLQPSGGAAGVLAASWRVPASRSFSALLLRELTRDDTTVGEAVLRAKREEPNRALIESYNLLGDPAMKLRLR